MFDPTRADAPRRSLVAGVMLTLSLASAGAHAADDCYEQAGSYQGVNPLVLRAVAWHESKGDASRDQSQRQWLDRRRPIADQFHQLFRPRAPGHSASRTDGPVHQRVRCRVAPQAGDGEVRQHVARDRRVSLEIAEGSAMPTRAAFSRFWSVGANCVPRYDRGTPRVSKLTHSAVDHDLRANDEPRFRRRQMQYRCRHFARLAEAAERNLRKHLCGGVIVETELFRAAAW
ncbi:hypothetical protein BRCH_03314c [Candidatus Burkholderia brachyanthoides]|nr:hypothetical protein BRCH_03314c [Candidatus Burkholderia brachyanthoides]